MRDKKNAPEIRFKGFLEPWEEKNLNKIGETYSGLTGKTKEDFGHGNARFITYMNVYANPIADINGVESIEIDNTQHVVEKGDIFFTTSSETPDEVAMSSVWLGNFNNIYLNSFCFGFHPKETIDSFYIAYLLRSMSFRNKVIPLAQGISRYNVSKNKVMDIKILIPPIKEQQKIGKFFSKIDDLIKFQQQKIDKLQNVKKSMLDKMFPKNGNTIPEIRSKGFSEPWEDFNLNSLVTFYSGLTYSPQNVAQEGTLVLRSSNVKNDEIIDADNIYVQNTIVNCENIKKGDIIVVVRNGSRALIGKHAQIKKDMPNTVIGAFMTGVRYSQSEFLNALLSTVHFSKEIEKNLGATINQITTGAFKEMSFLFPKNNNEQQKIGKFFSKIDDLIKFQQQKLEKLKNIKKSMLDKLFV